MPLFSQSGSRENNFPGEPSSAYTPRVIPEMLLFDIDGVITEPITGNVELRVVQEIVALLDKDDPVAFNTGRGLRWVTQDILPYFEKRISKRNALRNLCIVYQKGAFRITYSESGELKAPIASPNIILIPTPLRNEALQLIATKYAKTMFPGEEKEAVFSPQFKPNANFYQYKADQEKLVIDLQTMLHRHNQADQFRIDPTRIATDIEDKQLGKALGAQQVLVWLQEQRLQPEHFIAFGDSKLDIGMAEEIHRQGFPVEFVFVGEKSQLEGMQFPFPLYSTNAFCEQGTVEYLTMRKNGKRL